MKVSLRRTIVLEKTISLSEPIWSGCQIATHARQSFTYQLINLPKGMPIYVRDSKRWQKSQRLCLQCQNAICGKNRKSRKFSKRKNYCVTNGKGGPQQAVENQKYSKNRKDFVCSAKSLLRKSRKFCKSSKLNKTI